MRLTFELEYGPKEAVIFHEMINTLPGSEMSGWTLTRKQPKLVRHREVPILQPPVRRWDRIKAGKHDPRQERAKMLFEDQQNARYPSHDVLTPRFLAKPNVLYLKRSAISAGGSRVLKVISTNLVRKGQQVVVKQDRENRDRVTLRKRHSLTRTPPWGSGWGTLVATLQILSL